VASPLVDVDEVLAVLAALIPPDPSARGTSGLANADPQGFQFGHITATAAVEKARALGYQISKLTANLDLQGTILKADKLAFDLYGGHYESTLALDLASNKTTLDHRGRLAGANVAQLAALFGHAGLATGTLGVSMQVRGTGRDFERAAEGVNGSAAVTLSKGTLKGLDVVRQTFQLLGTAPPPNAGEKFDSLTAQLALAGGAMSADNLVLLAPDFDLKGQARVSPAGALSGQAQMTLSDALSKEAQGRNKDLKLLFEEGRITLPVTLSGTLQQPTVMPDLQSALKRAARNKINAELDKAKKRATGELQKGLDRLFRRP
jgi:AsmA protein